MDYGPLDDSWWFLRESVDMIIKHAVSGHIFFSRFLTYWQMYATQLYAGSLPNYEKQGLNPNSIWSSNGLDQVTESLSLHMTQEEKSFQYKDTFLQHLIKPSIQNMFSYWIDKLCAWGLHQQVDEGMDWCYYSIHWWLMTLLAGMGISNHTGSRLLEGNVCLQSSSKVKIFQHKLDGLSLKLVKKFNSNILILDNILWAGPSNCNTDQIVKTVHRPSTNCALQIVISNYYICQRLSECSSKISGIFYIGQWINRECIVLCSTDQNWSDVRSTLTTLMPSGQTAGKGNSF